MSSNGAPLKKIVHGLGAIKEAANEVKNLKGSKAFIVTDPGLAKIGVQKPLEEALTAAACRMGSCKREAQLNPAWIPFSTAPTKPRLSALT